MRRLAFVVSLVGATLTAGSAMAVEVLVSIKPLHSLVASVMGQTGTPTLLLDGAADPHSYALRPSDAQALRRAQLVFLAGGGLETFLDKPLRSLSKAPTVVRMADIPGITPLQPREGGLWEPDEDDDHGHHGHDDTVDPHLWLDPVNARAFVLAAGEALAAVDPTQAATYRTNAQATAQRIEILDSELGQMLRPVQRVPFLVFHDAFQYLDHHYGLTAAGSVSIDPERQPGAKRVKALRDRIKAGGIACMLRQPQFSPKLVDSLVSGLPVRVGVLDDLGATVPAGPEAYDTLLRNAATALRDCLAG